MPSEIARFSIRTCVKDTWTYVVNGEGGGSTIRLMQVAGLVEIVG